MCIRFDCQAGNLLSWLRILVGSLSLSSHMTGVSWNRPRSVGSDLLRTGRPGFDSQRGLGIFLFFIASIPALGPTQSPIQWAPGIISTVIKRPGREADHSPPSTVEFKKAWSYTSTPQGRFYLTFTLLYWWRMCVWTVIDSSISLIYPSTFFCSENPQCILSLGCLDILEMY